MEKRSFDITLYGATGFTGRLVAEYLAQHAPPPLRWALAGRNQQKLENVRSELTAQYPEISQLPIVVADAADISALNAAARNTRVICNLAGPYALYGEHLVAACAQHGTDYCDITGEVPFVRKMIDLHAERARQSGARLVHSCGFDSLPSDLGCQMVGDEMVRRGGTPSSVEFLVRKIRGGFSGGTFASFMNITKNADRTPKLRKLLADPWGLNPPEYASAEPSGHDRLGISYDNTLGSWTAPFFMSLVNTRIVHRSLALRAHPYGQRFKYSEAIQTGSGLMGFLRAYFITISLHGSLLATRWSFLRSVAAHYGPKPGDGPSKAKREQGFFTIDVVGRGTLNNQPMIVRGLIKGVEDPGYNETAKMIGETALCLALDDLKVRGGSWTPSTAMGSTLIPRLRRMGMTFDLQES